MERQPRRYAKAGDLIRERREVLGWSQQDFADRIGHDKAFVSRMERTDTPGYLPPFERIPVICDVLGIKQADLLAAAGYDIDPSTASEEDISDAMHEARLLEAAAAISDTPEQLQMFQDMVRIVRAARAQRL